MDIQTRTIQFLQEFLKIQNEDLLPRLENLLHAKSEREFKTMTVSEMNNRIDESMHDSENERLTSADDLMKEIKKWG